MTWTQNILKLRPLILVIGVAIAFSVIANPVLKNHVSNSASTSESKGHEKSNKGENEQTLTAQLEAVAPTAQSEVQPNSLLLEQLVEEFQIVKEGATAIFRNASYKLFQILFRLIISPNAP